MKTHKKAATAVDNNERPADLLFWFGDGFCGNHPAGVKTNTEVSIGRTNSKRALGFRIVNRKTESVLATQKFEFVLNRGQCEELAAYLRNMSSGLRKPPGRKQNNQLSLATANLPKNRLRNELTQAAYLAHPGWRRVDKYTIEQDDGAPDGAKLVAWFKRAHPKAAARIERALTKKLWEGA